MNLLRGQHVQSEKSGVASTGLTVEIGVMIPHLYFNKSILPEDQRLK